MVREFSRQYLTDKGVIYDLQDVYQMGLLQRWEELVTNGKYEHVICDTDLLTILIWQSVKYGHCDHHLLQLWKECPPDIYFLCVPDIPWEYDVLRENPFDRMGIFDIYKRWLDEYKMNYFILEGTFESKIELVIKQVTSFTNVNFHSDHSNNF